MDTCDSLRLIKTPQGLTTQAYGTSQWTYRPCPSLYAPVSISPPTLTWPWALSVLTTASPGAVSGAPGLSAAMAASWAASSALYCAVWSLEGLMM